jgi:hypothetical protein
VLALDLSNRNSIGGLFLKRVFITFIFFLLVGCNQGQELDSPGSPPPVSIEVDGTQYSMKMGSFRWTKKGPFSSTTSVADAPSPNQIAVNMESVIVNGESEVTIHTKGEPSLSVNLWNEEALEKGISIQGNQFTIPNQTGRYIYEVFAEWEEGDASFTVVFEVE